MITLPDYTNILLFSLSSIILVVTPGPAFLYIFTKTTEKGYKAGILSVLGIETGTLLHIITVAFGFSTTLVNSSITFTIITYGGAIYLIFLGIKTFYSTYSNSKNTLIIKSATSNDFWSGVMVSALNPKSILFFVVFLPQFVNITKRNEASQILFLGLLFIIIAVAWGCIFVSLSSKLGNYLKTKLTNHKAFTYIVGIIYIGIGFFSLLFFTK
ncbi:LysE family translocator [Tenacibaculum ascidiaceicola]|uniref:LysE family translocator n=1 Tax=Tenacibaculum ascidiaceicola TaxID=1699411 RepID=UPI0039ECC002